MPRIRNVSPDLPPSLTATMLVDGTGRPRYWASVWQTLYGPGLAASTLAGKLSYIERLYQVAQEQTGADCLDRLIAKRNFCAIEAAAEGYFVSVRNRSAINNTDGNQDWLCAIAFLKDIMQLHAASGTVSQIDRLSSHLSTLERLYRSLKPSAIGRKPALIRALPAQVVEEFYELVDPTGIRNPFRTHVGRWRNYVLFLLYLHQGLRRGEALILPSNAMRDAVDSRSGEVRYWLDVESNEAEDDPRYVAPSIKTRLSRRQIPVSTEIVTAVDHYVDSLRGKPDTGFLFVSNQGTPLAVNSVNLIFETLSAAMSDSARTCLRNRMHSEAVTPHDLRHTCAVVRLSEFVESGMEMKLALQELRAFFGWSPASNMPIHYSRAYFEDRLRTVWRKKFDDRVDVLRQLLKLKEGGDVLSFDHP